MKTEIKNTLYRFITMRAPELQEKKVVDENFVQHPEVKDEVLSYESVFLESINPIPNGQTKKQVLINTANNFAGEAIKNRTDLRKFFNVNYYDFAIWLTKNRTTFTTEEITDWVEKFPTLTTDRLTDVNRIELWDNLFYQIITFKSNYVRDELISLLVADFFIDLYKKNDSVERMREIAQARIIMPKLLFEVEEDTKGSDANNKVNLKKILNTKGLDDVNSLLAIESEKNQLEHIRKMLVSAENKYNISNNDKLKQYNAQFETDTKKAYDAATATIVDYTDTEPSTDKQKSYTKYENLVLPEYNFEPLKELEYAVSGPYKSTILSNFITRCSEDLLFTTFKEVYAFIDDKIKTLTARQFEKTTISKRVANINGIVFSDSGITNSYARTSAAFMLTTMNLGVNKYLVLTFNGMEPGTDIISGNYTITFENNDTLEGEYQNPANSSEWINGKLVLKICNYTSHYFLVAEDDTFTITGSFYSSVGRELTINGSGQVYDNYNNNMSYDIADLDGNPTNYGAYTVNYVANGKGTYTYEDLVSGSTGSTGSTDSDSSASSGATPPGAGSSQAPSTSVTQNVVEYIPSGYGIKRLGIADYRRVEQEICCYVPGEVSHIENVMAREYKEKATRRLRRQEDTITTSKEKETEKLTDTTSTDRFEMNQEVASVMSEQNAFSAGSEISWNGHVSGAAHADFAHNTSQETSNNQALSSAQEITEKVLERVVQKVKEERITKIIEEFEETSKHGYDNRKGDKHVSGVYRWVDKIYRNQVVNYGKRLMYEFMIPEPAAFHNMAVENKTNTYAAEELIKPVDPRTVEGGLALKDFTKVSEVTYPYWAAIYNAEVEAMPLSEIAVGESFSIISHPAGAKIGETESNAGNGKITIPEGYYTYWAIGYFSASGDNDYDGNILSLTIGDASDKYTQQLYGYEMKYEKEISAFVNEVPVSFTLGNHVAGNLVATVKCKLGDQAKKQWQIETFNAIISAYEDRLKEYNDKLAELKAAQLSKAKMNPLFYRQIENTVLRKNCIEYMISHDVLGKESLLQGTSLPDFRVQYDNPGLETYSAKIRFFEQAFEWDLMSYIFYPFYWANRQNWKELYNVEEFDDPVFRAFLQSGMARVIITVRPGFEEAVNWYMATGQVWNGGQVPTIDDPLFVSIVKELQQPEGVVEETWESRVPTSLTVIQAGTIGLNVEGLPCDKDCEDNLLFDSDGNPVLDENGNQMSVIGQNDDSVQLGNITDDLQSVTDSIEEIKDDIEEIKTTLEGMSGGN